MSRDAIGAWLQRAGTTETELRSAAHRQRVDEALLEQLMHVNAHLQFIGDLLATHTTNGRNA